MHVYGNIFRACFFSLAVDPDESSMHVFLWSCNNMTIRWKNLISLMISILCASHLYVHVQMNENDADCTELSAFFTVIASRIF